MSEKALLVFLGVRVACVPLIQTWFVPDEYWQATEVAHNIAFRYGYKTWEWHEGIRSVLYPGFLAGLFRLLAFLGVDSPTFLIHTPRIFHAVVFAVGDYHFWRLSKTLYGNNSAWWTAVCLSTSWFLGYCAPRTLTSCLEMVLLAVAFSSYPWRRERESYSARYLWPVGLACAVRPTAAVPFLPLALQHLWHSHHRCRLLLHYIAITITIMALTVALDSWYYGTLAVVPWRFIHFNVVSGLSAHYGTLPWHWYVSQGVPATLTTHLVPFFLALVSQPARHKGLLRVILWSLLVYSCLGHKEFRFLLPVLPLCMCVAGDFIAFHLTAHAKRSSHSSGLRRSVIIVSLLLPNTCALLYLGLVHQRGALDVMQVLREEIDAHQHPDILFLMPCHSTPYYSHLHRNVTMRFLTCEPNLAGVEGYVDEADLFDEDPLIWLLQEFGGEVEGNSLTEKEDEWLYGSDRKKMKEKELKLLEKERMDMKEEDNMEKEKEQRAEKRGNVDKTVGGKEIGGEMERTRENADIAIGEEGNRIKTKLPPHKLPSHIVMFSVLSEKVEEFLLLHHYHLHRELFHAHINDGRRSTHIHVYRRTRSRG